MRISEFIEQLHKMNPDGEVFMSVYGDIFPVEGTGILPDILEADITGVVIYGEDV